MNCVVMDAKEDAVAETVCKIALMADTVTVYAAVNVSVNGVDFRT